MYRRYYRNDELISNVLVAFALLLLFGFLVSWKLVGEDTFDLEMYLYIGLASITGLLFLASLILFFIGNRKPFIDIEINISEETIYTHNRMKKHSFQDILLYSYNIRHGQLRLFFGHYVMGIPISDMQTSKNVSLTEKEIDAITKYGLEVHSKSLYNYHILVVLVFVGSMIGYMVWASKTQKAIFGSYIPTYYAFIVCIFFSILVVFLNHYRLRKLHQSLLTKDTE